MTWALLLTRLALVVVMKVFVILVVDSYFRCTPLARSVLCGMT